MATTAGRMEPRVEGILGNLLIVGEEGSHAAEVAELLAARGHAITRVDDAEQALAAFDREFPGLVIFARQDDCPAAGLQSIRASTARRNVPLLLVTDDLPSDSPDEVARLALVDDWIPIGGVANELSLRVARLLHRGRSSCPKSSPDAEVNFGPHFLPLLVHDLRTPLNVMGLSLRIISRVVPRHDPDVLQDLRFLDENFQLMVRMLQQLSDFHRLYETRGPLDPIPFDARRLADEVLSELRLKGPQRASDLVLVIDPSCPPEVALDPLRAKMAMQYALTNALAAATQGKGVVVRLLGEGAGENARFLIEFLVEQPPPATVCSMQLDPLEFERIQGTEFERRGIDLAIAARVGQIFGGTSRIEAIAGNRTRVVLEWPVRLAPPIR